MDRRILLVHNNPECSAMLARALARPDWGIKRALDGTSALELLVDGQFALAVVATHLPDVGGAEIVRETLARELPVSFILLRPGDAGDAPVAPPAHAVRVLEEPVDPRHLAFVVEQALADRQLRDDVETLRADRAAGGSGPDLFVTSGRRMTEIIDLARNRQANNGLWVISGEPGAGKTRLAQHLHASIWQRRGALVTLVCNRLTDSTLAPAVGRANACHADTPDCENAFLQARGGTLVLDEVQHLSLGLQAALLERLRDGADQRHDVRIIMLSTADLAAAAANGSFKPELLELAANRTFSLPPLRDRDPEDLVGLVNTTLTRLAGRGFRETTLATETFACLAQYHWPGNVRELESVLERLVATSNTDPIAPAELPTRLAQVRDEERLLHFDPNRKIAEITRELRRRIEIIYLSQALRISRGRIKDVAAISGLTRRSISAKLHEFGINKNNYKSKIRPRKPRAANADQPPRRARA